MNFNLIKTKLISLMRDFFMKVDSLLQFYLTSFDIRDASIQGWSDKPYLARLGDRYLAEARYWLGGKEYDIVVRKRGTTLQKISFGVHYDALSEKIWSLVKAIFLFIPGILCKKLAWLKDSQYKRRYYDMQLTIQAGKKCKGLVASTNKTVFEVEESSRKRDWVEQQQEHIRKDQFSCSILSRKNPSAENFWKPLPEVIQLKILDHLAKIDLVRFGQASKCCQQAIFELSLKRRYAKIIPVIISHHFKQAISTWPYIPSQVTLDSFFARIEKFKKFNPICILRVLGTNPIQRVERKDARYLFVRFLDQTPLKPQMRLLIMRQKKENRNWRLMPQGIPRPLWRFLKGAIQGKKQVTQEQRNYLIRLLNQEPCGPIAVNRQARWHRDYFFEKTDLPATIQVI